MRIAIATTVSVTSSLALLVVLSWMLISVARGESPAAGETWGAWRGSAATGGSESGKPVTEWSEEKNVKSGWSG